MKQNSLVRIDFSLRREVFFVVIATIIGGIPMVVPITYLYTGLDLPYYLSWMAFGHFRPCFVDCTTIWNTSASLGSGIYHVYFLLAHVHILWV